MPLALVPLTLLFWILERDWRDHSGVQEVQTYWYTDTLLPDGSKPWTERAPLSNQALHPEQ